MDPYTPFAEEAPVGNRILRVLISPPKMDPFEFHRERRGGMNKADRTDEEGDKLRDAVRFADPNATYRRPRTRSASRPIRG